MTDLWGAAAMVVAANRAVRTERVAKRMLSGVCVRNRASGVFVSA
jgi:mannose/fructose-specific phosphotransferase system component IIA